MTTETIYVALIDEGVDVWRPVEAEPLGDDRYRLVSPPDFDPDTETWAFPPGSVVLCEERALSDGPALVAVQEVPTLPAC